MSKLKIACDIDGCVCDLSDAILDFAKKKSLNIDTSKYPWLGDDVFRKHPEIFKAGRAVKGAAETLKSLSSSYDVIFITSRPVEGAKETAEWLKDAGMDYPVYHTTRRKGEIAAAQGVDMAIDDSPVEISSYKDAGIPVLMCEHTYNRDVEAMRMVWA